MARHVHAPGVVRVRLSGELADVAETADRFTRSVDAEVIEASGPYPNRNSTGVRVYLTLRLTSETPRPSTGRRRALGTGPNT